MRLWLPLARKVRREKKKKASRIRDNSGVRSPRVLAVSRNFRRSVEETKGNEKIIHRGEKERNKTKREREREREEREKKRKRTDFLSKNVKGALVARFSSRVLGRDFPWSRHSPTFSGTYFGRGNHPEPAVVYSHVTQSPEMACRRRAARTAIECNLASDPSYLGGARQSVTCYTYAAH